jgi:hypothetical protein
MKDRRCSARITEAKRDGFLRRVCFSVNMLWITCL